MRDMNPKPIRESHDQPGEELDHVLDTLLTRYSAVEARTGLEERVLANLRAEREQAATCSWRRWSLAATLAVALLILALAWGSGRPAHTLIASRPPTTAPAVEQRSRIGALKKSTNNDNRRPSTVAMRRSMRRPLHESVAVRDPKLDQFPSPRPLSQEELLLVQYVQEFPEDAVMMAKLQEESEREIERLNKNPSGSNPAQEQDQQER